MRDKRKWFPASLSLERSNLRYILYVLQTIPRGTELQLPTGETHSFMHPGWVFFPLVSLSPLFLVLLEIAS